MFIKILFYFFLYKYYTIIYVCSILLCFYKNYIYINTVCTELFIFDVCYNYINIACISHLCVLYTIHINVILKVIRY